MNGENSSSIGTGTTNASNQNGTVSKINNGTTVASNGVTTTDVNPTKTNDSEDAVGFNPVPFNHNSIGIDRNIAMANKNSSIEHTNTLNSRTYTDIPLSASNNGPAGSSSITNEDNRPILSDTSVSSGPHTYQVPLTGGPDGPRRSVPPWQPVRNQWEHPREDSEGSSLVGGPPGGRRRLYSEVSSLIGRGGEGARYPDSRRSLSGWATDTETLGTSPGEHRTRRNSFRKRKPNSPAVLYSVSRRSSFGSTSSLVERPRRAVSEPGEPVEDLEVIDEVTSSESGSVSLRSMTRAEKFTVINFCLTNFCVGAFYSLLAPFFSTEAYKKGVSATIVGLIFASFEMTLFITAPIFGTFMSHIGAKFTYVAGVFVCGVGAILFGFLDGAPDGTIYIVMCFVVRFVEALGASAFSTASFAIMAHTFPNNVAAMFGSLELFSGLGLMVGPPIGGALFQLGGFKLPFVSLGSLVVVVGILSIFLLPYQNIERSDSEGSALSLLRIPIIPIVGFCLFCGAGSLGFFDVTLADYLTKTFGLTPVIIGVVFLVGPGVYAITAPIWGRVSDKFPQYNRILICIGYTISGIAMFFVGPAPFFNIQPMLWLPILSMILNGFGVATLVIAFPVIAEATMSRGYPDNLATYGLIAGVFNSFFSLGACMGPLGGGYLHETIKFESACVVVGCLELFAAFLLFIYIIVTRFCWQSLDPLSNPDTEAQQNKPNKNNNDATTTDSESHPLISNNVTSSRNGTRLSNGFVDLMSDTDSSRSERRIGRYNPRLYRQSQ